MKRVRRIEPSSFEVVSSSIGKRKKKEPSQPPRSDKQFVDIIHNLRSRNIFLAYTLEMQALTGLRYSDCSCLKFTDFYRNEEFVDSFVIYQQKIFYNKVTRLTKKGEKTEAEILRAAFEASKVLIYTNERIKQIVEECKVFNGHREFLFANSHHRSKGRPMDIRNADYHLKKVETDLKLNFNLGTHSFRKIFALKLLANNVTLEKIRDLLGQKSLTSTSKYLSTIDVELQAVVSELSYKAG
ncbi:site-specific integrase [Vibrio sp. D431a]|uniref:tyrosine-type recombinase/integrase n=1 Tax=Vibrio sp. D431a TaxID=2837388 RepID=UPI002553638C|nr:site-specific integrase [Vibrio sp. D431a]